MNKSYQPLTKCLCTNTWISYIKDQGWQRKDCMKGSTMMKSSCVMSRTGCPHSRSIDRAKSFLTPKILYKRIP